MKKYLTALLFLLCIIRVRAQVIDKRDPEIKRMTDEVSRQNIEKDVRTLVDFYTRHDLSMQNDPERGIGAAWNWIKKEMEKSIPASGGRLSVAFEDYTAGGEGERIPHKVNLKNVVATIKGIDPADDRIIVVSAHLDSRATVDNDSTSCAPGADDDGSGVAAVLELTRILSKEKFPATIVLMAVSGEEQGLYGSQHMAMKAKEEKWNIIAMLNNDMIGNSRSSGTLLSDNMKLRVFSEGIPAVETKREEALRKYTAGDNDSRSRQLARYVKETGERYADQLGVTLIFRNDRFGRGGDQTPFSRSGFTAVRLCEFNENYDHTHKVPAMVNGIREGDLPEFVDYEYVRKNTCVNLAVIANLALAPYEPSNCNIIISGLTNNTTIRWETPQKGKKPEGYYILMRETYKPLWEKKIFVKGNEVTLPYSKDNYFFAVQSVDDEGHESLAVFPGVSRK